MKKTYFKPVLLAENLALSSVSSSCYAISNATERTCSVYIDDLGWNVVIDSVYGCEITTPESSDWLCYHGPFDASNVYSS